MALNTRKWFGLVLLVWLSATITVGLQQWVGDQTIYAQKIEQQREAFHFGILANEAPGGGSWGAVGGQSIQKRIGIVYLAESIRAATDLSVGKIYKLLDSVFLFISIVLLYFFLRRWLSQTYSLLGVLYFCAVLPLTYFFQLFHPWDRPQMAIWLVLLYLVASGRFYSLAAVLVVSILIKFDTVLLPFFYFMVHFSQARWRRTGGETLVLLVAAFGTYAALGHWFPDPLDSSRFTVDVALVTLERNLQVLLGMHLRYPPLLVHALPVLLALLFLPGKDRFVWTAVVFGLGLAGVYVTFTLFEEVRTHMIVLVLVMPSALISLQHLLEGDAGRGRGNGN
jgi:hypothetical protein